MIRMVTLSQYMRWRQSDDVRLVGAWYNIAHCSVIALSDVVVYRQLLLSEGDSIEAEIQRSYIKSWMNDCRRSWSDKLIARFVIDWLFLYSTRKLSLE